MRAPGSIVILAEDLSGACFVEAFLRGRGARTRAIVTKVPPEARGSGKAWVTANYAAEVRAHRRRAAHTWKALIVCTDADELTLDERLAQLAQALDEYQDEGVPAPLAPRGDAERIVLLVPKWEIETWALHLLAGVAVAEHQRAVRWSPEESRRHCVAAGGLWDTHRPPAGPMPGCCPDALVRADDERSRI